MLQIRFGQIKFDQTAQQVIETHSKLFQGLEYAVDSFNKGPHADMDATISFTRLAMDFREDGTIRSSAPTFKIQVPGQEPLYYHSMTMTGGRHWLKDIMNDIIQLNRKQPATSGLNEMEIPGKGYIEHHLNRYIQAV